MLPCTCTYLQQDLEKEFLKLPSLILIDAILVDTVMGADHSELFSLLSYFLSKNAAFLTKIPGKMKGRKKTSVFQSFLIISTQFFPSLNFIAILKIWNNAY